MGRAARQALSAIKNLKRAERNPLSGVLALNKKDANGTANGGFGWNRLSGDGEKKAHQGNDFAAEVGTPVFAVESGKVIILPKSGSYGYQVIIDHGNGIYTQYAHLDAEVIDRKIGNNSKRERVFIFKDKDGSSRELKSGDTIKAGDQIGAVGRSGNVPKNGRSHLHFEVRYGNDGRDPAKRTLINPMYYLPLD